MSTAEGVSPVGEYAGALFHMERPMTVFMLIRLTHTTAEGY